MDRNLRVTIVKGPWSRREDDQLRNLLDQFREFHPNQQISWKNIEESMQSRTAKQCRERWTNHLNNVNKSPLTEEEGRCILQIRQNEPNLSYVQIAERIPGRTALIIKNYIYRERVKEKKSLYRIRQRMSINNYI